MNERLARWNSLDTVAAAREILPCCGSEAWAAELTAQRPVADTETLLALSDRVWTSLPQSAWQQAFDSHPRIGQQKAQGAVTEESLRWSSAEQSAAMTPDETLKAALAEGNRRYEQRFGRIFILRASGRPAPEILAILEERMKHDAVTELHEAAEQQRQITQLRLEKWLRAGEEG